MFGWQVSCLSQLRPAVDRLLDVKREQRQLGPMPKRKFKGAEKEAGVSPAGAIANRGSAAQVRPEPNSSIPSHE